MQEFLVGWAEERNPIDEGEVTAGLLGLLRRPNRRGTVVFDPEREDLHSLSGVGARQRRSGVASVPRDFHAAVDLTGLEAMLTAEAQTTLDAKTTRHPRTVNRAVSFNAIKDRALDLLFSDLDTATLCRRLTTLLLWALLRPARLDAACREVLESPEHQVFCSAVNIRETAIKRTLDRGESTTRRGKSTSLTNGQKKSATGVAL